MDHPQSRCGKEFIGLFNVSLRQLIQTFKPCSCKNSPAPTPHYLNALKALYPPTFIPWYALRMEKNKTPGCDVYLWQVLCEEGDMNDINQGEILHRLVGVLPSWQDYRDASELLLLVPSLHLSLLNTWELSYEPVDALKNYLQPLAISLFIFISSLKAVHKFLYGDWCEGLNVRIVGEVHSERATYHCRHTLQNPRYASNCYVLSSGEAWISHFGSCTAWLTEKGGRLKWLRGILVIKTGSPLS